MNHDAEFHALHNLLQRTLADWWKAVQLADWNHAAYLSNDAEAAGRYAAHLTHRAYEETLRAATQAPPNQHPSARVPAEKGE